MKFWWYDDSKMQFQTKANIVNPINSVECIFVFLSLSFAPSMLFLK